MMDGFTRWIMLMVGNKSYVCPYTQIIYFKYV
jgi:hypothetical protein